MTKTIVGRVVQSLIFCALALLITVPALADARDACRQKLIQAQQLDVLADLDWKPGKFPKVVVGPTFARMPFDAKEGFARTVNCFLVGEGQYIDFDLLDHLNHHVVGSWERGRLKMK